MKWPFTVSKGVLECKGVKNVVLTANGTTYGINGKARGKKKYVDFATTIWRDDPEMEGFKVPLGDIIKRGLKLCR